MGKVAALLPCFSIQIWLALTDVAGDYMGLYGEHPIFFVRIHGM